MIKLKISFVLLVLLGSFSSWSSERLEGASFGLVAEQASKLATKYGASNVLVAYDIDNTLMAPNQELSSDEWFAWQGGLIEKAKKDGAPIPKEAVANSFPGLLQVLQKLYWLTSTHVVDSKAPEVVDQIQKKGITSMVITSRGALNRIPTLRELEKNGFHFDRVAFALKPGTESVFVPYDLSKLADAGLTKEDEVAFHLQPPRKISYSGGVLMVEGQHKGAMLRVLLHKAKRKFKAILFVDDTPAHVDGMQAAFAHAPVDLVTVRYAGSDAKIKKFEDGDKGKANEDWATLKAAFVKVFGESLEH